MARKKEGPGVHAHGCKKCKGRYEDACSQMEVNGLCSYCEYGRGWDELRDARLPHDCCKLHSVPVRVDKQMKIDEMKQYKLSKGCLWFKCDFCSRTHPFINPTPAGRWTPIDPNVRRG